jgi:hypothetical protein
VKLLEKAVAIVSAFSVLKKLQQNGQFSASCNNCEQQLCDLTDLKENGTVGSYFLLGCIDRSLS